MRVERPQESVDSPIGTLALLDRFEAPFILLAPDADSQTLRESFGQQQNALKIVPPELVCGINLLTGDENGSGNASRLKQGVRVLIVVRISIIESDSHGPLWKRALAYSIDQVKERHRAARAIDVLQLLGKTIR
jgi:hypothetical protein